MPFPTGTFTGVQLANVIPEIWSPKFNDFFRAKLVFANHFEDFSGEASGGGDIINIPTFAEFTTNSKVTATAVDLENQTVGNNPLTIDQWIYSAFAIEDRELAQTANIYRLVNIYAKNAAFVTAKAVETTIASLFASFTQIVGVTATDLTQEVIAEAIGTLESVDVDVYGDGGMWFFHPLVYWRQVQGKLSTFVTNDNSPVQDPVSRKPMLMFFGLPLKTTTLVPLDGATTGRINLLATPEAIAWAKSPLGANGSMGSSGASSADGGAPIRLQSSYELELLSTLAIADILYGAIVNRDESGVQVISNL